MAVFLHAMMRPIHKTAHVARYPDRTRSPEEAWCKGDFCGLALGGGLSVPLSHDLCDLAQRRLQAVSVERLKSAGCRLCLWSGSREFFVDGNMLFCVLSGAWGIGS